MLSSGSSKRPRLPSNCSQIASCLVDGCVSDLSKCREYHRRHKVCEAHSKTAVVMVSGREQRFCQQCSRFHLLVEFDEVKRSCRKRLDGHNKRRRKPQPENHRQGNMFSYGHVLTTNAARSDWPPTLIKTEGGPPFYGHFPLSSRGSYKDAKQFPFSLASSSSSSSSSSCSALSLLSSSVGPTQPPIPPLHYVAQSQFSVSQTSDMDNTMLAVSDDLFHAGTLPFNWQ